MGNSQMTSKDYDKLYAKLSTFWQQKDSMEYVEPMSLELIKEEVKVEVSTIYSKPANSDSVFSRDQSPFEAKHSGYSLNCKECNFTTKFKRYLKSHNLHNHSESNK